MFQWFPCGPKQCSRTRGAKLVMTMEARYREARRRTRRACAEDRSVSERSPRSGLRVSSSCAVSAPRWRNFNRYTVRIEKRCKLLQTKDGVSLQSVHFRRLLSFASLGPSGCAHFFGTMLPLGGKEIGPCQTPIVHFRVSCQPKLFWWRPLPFFAAPRSV